MDRPVLRFRMQHVPEFETSPIRVEETTACAHYFQPAKIGMITLGNICFQYPTLSNRVLVKTWSIALTMHIYIFGRHLPMVTLCLLQCGTV